MSDDTSPPMHPDHRLDRLLLSAAIDQLEQARAPRSDPVPAAVDIALPDNLPERGAGPQAALQHLAPLVLGRAAQLHHPGYLAHMDPPTPLIAWAAALWQVASNQNLLHPDVAPVARGLESTVMSWLAPAFGMGGGHMVPGSTVGNLTALWAARELKGIRRIVASERAHLSMRKAADILGLVFEPAATDQDHRLLLDRLPGLRDAALVLTAGTVATGAIDPLSRADAAWVHVDAAWGGPLRLTDRYRALLDGVEDADSVGFSAHKWLYQPKGTALIMFKDAPAAHAAMSYGGGYLAAPNIGLLGSAPATALPLAATLLAWGRAGLAERIEADMAKANLLVELIEADDRFELWGEHRSGVVVWRPRGVAAAQVRSRLSDAWVSLTEIDGETWFRCVTANPNADPRHVVARVAAALKMER